MSFDRLIFICRCQCGVTTRGPLKRSWPIHKLFSNKKIPDSKIISYKSKSVKCSIAAKKCMNYCQGLRKYISMLHVSMLRVYRVVQCISVWVKKELKKNFLHSL